MKTIDLIPVILDPGEITARLRFDPVRAGYKLNYVFKAQYDEYCRLFGKGPAQIDGHHKSSSDKGRRGTDPISRMVILLSFITEPNI